MLDTFKVLLVKQFEASLSVLNGCVEVCPETVWNARVANHRFCQVAFHTLFWTDYYLGRDGREGTEGSFRHQPFHLRNERLFADYEEFEDRAPVRLYDKPDISTYMAYCRAKMSEVIAAETAQTLSALSGLRNPDLPRAEVHVYNIRHIQHHAAQLSLRLRLDTHAGMRWVGSGWREAALVAERPG